MNLAFPRALMGGVLVALALAGCGTGSSEPSHLISTPTRSPYIARANQICGMMLRETRQLGRRFIKAVAATDQPSLLALETKALLGPGLGVLDRASKQLRAVSARAQDAALGVYVGLFEPIIQLGELRLHAGRTGNFAESQNLEQQMEQLGEEQRTAARLAGARTCGVNFLHALTAAWRIK